MFSGGAFVLSCLVFIFVFGFEDLGSPGEGDRIGPEGRLARWLAVVAVYEFRYNEQSGRWKIGDGEELRDERTGSVGPQKGRECESESPNQSINQYIIRTK